jgi:hypothetical protein
MCLKTKCWEENLDLRRMKISVERGGEEEEEETA